MNHLIIPQDYRSALNLHDTQIGIKTVKDFFQNLLAERLHLLRVSAPLESKNRVTLRLKSYTPLQNGSGLPCKSTVFPTVKVSIRT